MSITSTQSYRSGDMVTKQSTTQSASTPVMKMVTAFVKFISIPLKGFGRFCVPGFGPIEEFVNKSYPCILGFSSLFIMQKNADVRCYPLLYKSW